MRKRERDETLEASGMLLREEGFQKPNPPKRVAASLTDSNGAEVSISPTKEKPKTIA